MSETKYTIHRYAGPISFLPTETDKRILTPKESQILKQSAEPSKYAGLLAAIEGPLLPRTDLEEARDVARDLLAFLEIHMPGITDANAAQFPWLGGPPSSEHRRKDQAIEGGGTLVLSEPEDRR